MVAEIWASVISSFVDQLVALTYVISYPVYELTDVSFPVIF